MLIWSARASEGHKFIWGLPVYADACPGQPRGHVWGEIVHWRIPDGSEHSNRPIIYTRLPPVWRAPRIPGP